MHEPQRRISNKIYSKHRHKNHYTQFSGKHRAYSGQHKPGNGERKSLRVDPMLPQERSDVYNDSGLNNE